MASVEPVTSPELDDLVRALGVDHHDPVGVLGPEGLDVLGPEALVHRAVPLPQQQRGLLHLAVGQAAQGLPRVPDPHVVGAVAELVAGVAAEVLVGEEEHALAALEGPGEHGPGVGRGADRPAVAADEGLQGGRGVHVGHRDEAVDVDDPGQVLPGLLDLVDVGHVGHGAAGVEVGEHDLLVVAGQDVGRLGHEVDAAEDDELGVGLAGGQAGEPEGVAPGVGPAHDVVALVVVAEDEEPGAERRPWRRRSWRPARRRSRRV